MFDFKRLEPSHRKRQPPGMSSNDIKQSAQRMVDIQTALGLVNDVSRAIHAGDERALLRKLRELEADLERSDPRKGAQS